MPATNFLTLETARNRLAAIWLILVAPFILILVLQSLIGVYGDKVQEVWGWALPTILPTLGMIITVLVYTALDPSASAAVVRRSFFRISCGASLFYLLLVLLTVLIQPYLPATAARVNAMRLSNLWLGPIQSSVASALGVLFVSKKPAVQE
jgi:hypothetical protein